MLTDSFYSVRICKLLVFLVPEPLAFSAEFQPIDMFYGMEKGFFADSKGVKHWADQIAWSRILLTGNDDFEYVSQGNVILFLPVPPAQISPHVFAKAQGEKHIPFGPFFLYVVGADQVGGNIFPLLNGHAVYPLRKFLMPTST